MSEETARKKGETSVKDTIESILVAFILAFIFRCFVVEAFVIPTGSMAPTLLGAHMDFRCPECGYQYTHGFHNENETYTIPDAIAGNVRSECPNCGYRLPADSASDPDNDATNPPLRYGDRILVMKYVYLFNEPSRWDVVVFKSPMTNVGDYSVNYIKRLVGNPGESIVVAHGDLYVAPPGANAADPSQYVVQPKPRWAQDALWRIVFDADYVPQSARNGPVVRDHAWRQPWQQTAGSGWINDDASRGVSPRDFTFDNLTGNGVLEFTPIRYSNDIDGVSDYLAYNQQFSALRPVGDLKLEFFVTGLQGEGVIRAIVSKHRPSKTDDHEFVAELSAGKARLLMRSADGEKVIGERNINLTGNHHVSIENADYRVIVRVDDADLITTTPDDYRPDLAAIVKNADDPFAGAARIEGDRVAANLTHLRLWRDIYYRDDGANGSSQPTHGVVQGHHFRPMTLKDREYFTLGDNSAMSLDGRFWSVPIQLDDEDLNAPAGVVPERFLLGKAFFVYWPAGYKPVSAVSLRAAPNFGNMRFIR